MASSTHEDVHVLCLHGCCQHEQIFRQLLKHLLKMAARETKNGVINKEIIFHFLEAKYDHPDGGKTWWMKPLVTEKVGTYVYNQELREDTLEAVTEIRSYILEHNITALLGFSQGANACDVILSYPGADGTLVEDDEVISQIKSVVFMSGYDFLDSDSCFERQPPLHVKTLQVYSEKDELVSPKFKPKFYDEVEPIVHDKGHKIPTSKPQLRQIVHFLAGI